MSIQSQDPTPPPARAITLGFLLRELYDVLQRQVYAALAEEGHADIREMHSPVLRHLPPGGARVADLARQSGLAKQSVAYIVQDLTDLGYVKVGPDPEDGRAKRVVLTSRGRRLTARLLALSDQAERVLSTRLGKEQVASLRSILERAIDHPATGR